MGRRRVGNAFVIIVMIILIGWPLYQVYDLVQAKYEKHDATRLLFQVSLFQMELLSSFVNEAGQIQTTGELNALKQAMYSMNFTHERLVLAVGNESLGAMYSLPELMQFILRLQIGGERSLKPGEVDLLKQVGEKFKEMYAAYELLMTSHGDIVSSQNKKLIQIDEEISTYVKEKQLE